MIYAQLHRWAACMQTREGRKLRDAVRDLFERQHGIDCLTCHRSNECTTPEQDAESLKLWLRWLNLDVQITPDPPKRSKADLAARAAWPFEPEVPRKQPKRSSKAAKASRAWQPLDLGL